MTSVSATLLSPSDRDRALRAISSLCAERGYLETSVEEVAARAGIELEAFHELFADKEECAIAAVNAILSEMMSVAAGSYSAYRSEWDNVLVGIKAILELMAANPSFAYISYIAARQMASPKVQASQEPGILLLRAMLGRLWSYADVNAARSDSVPVGALGGPEAVVRREIVRGRAEQLPRLLPDLVYAATVPFLGRPEALRLARRGRELLAQTQWAR